MRAAVTGVAAVLAFGGRASGSLEPVDTTPGEPVTVPVCMYDAREIDVVTSPQHGTLSADPNNCTVTYTPLPGFTGQDPFTLRSTDLSGEVVVERFEAVVKLPKTSAYHLPALGAEACGLLLFGSAVTVGVRRSRRRR